MWLLTEGLANGNVFQQCHKRKYYEARTQVFTHFSESNRKCIGPIAMRESKWRELKIWKSFSDRSCK
jgi:hypothetical protein